MSLKINLDPRLFAPKIQATKVSTNPRLEAAANKQIMRLINRDDSIEIPATPHQDQSHLPEKLVEDDFPWDESQLEAITTLAKVQAGCLIGAAGTGKTTCEKKLVDTLIHGDEKLGITPMPANKVDLNRYWIKDGPGTEVIADKGLQREDLAAVPAILLCAFTGQATQNIKKNFPRSWHPNIMTIHSALGYYPESTEYVDPESGKIKESWMFVPYYTKLIKMPWDAIIIDEASMANVELWHQLLDASKPGTRFYFIGDINQLTPPIGQGVLGFAMARLPVAELRHIHRQKEAAANRIIETAWDILQGKAPTFDDPRTNKDWRVLGYEIPHAVPVAAQQILSIAAALRSKTIEVNVEDEETGGLKTIKDYPIYDPWRDRIITCMNGANPGDPSSGIGQVPLNETLAMIFSDQIERTIIDAGRETKKFAVGYRVMATKNEPPSVKDRITNGTTGIITEITANEKYIGDSQLFGPEKSVRAYRKELIADLDKKDDTPFEFEAEDFNGVNVDEKDERTRGTSSHTVHVDFNGIQRSFRLKTEVEQLQLAYASTVHKTQGSEMDTAIVIIHHAQKRMLCRESLYTAVTRATKRLIILYTPHGMKLSLAKQKIFGSTIQEKTKQYLAMSTSGDNGGMPMLNVRLSHDDPIVKRSNLI